MEEIDLTIFEKEFDAHGRGRQCIRTLKGIQANSHPKTKEKLSTFNQQKLLEYAADMAKRIQREEFSFSSFEKNLGEDWKFCLTIGDKRVTEITEAEIKVWWDKELERYTNKKIAWATLLKEYICIQLFIKWVQGIHHTHQLPIMENLYLPKKPKAKLMERMPTQEEVKSLIDAAYASDKYSIRNQAILALANDSGARISEMLSMRNKHIKPEKNYLVVSFPESKTTPRTVISYLAKPYLEAWAKVSPNKDKGPDAFFFCQSNGDCVRYTCVAKAFNRALEKAQIPWKDGKCLHFFRSLFSSRAYNWSYNCKHVWLGWSLKDHERSYTQIGYQQCVEQYFSMIKAEHNPFLKEETPHWDEESIDEKIMEKLINEKPEFRLLLRQMVREIASSS